VNMPEWACRKGKEEMKILVTGAAGNSNQVLIPKLLEARH